MAPSFQISFKSVSTDQCSPRAKNLNILLLTPLGSFINFFNHFQSHSLVICQQYSHTTMPPKKRNPKEILLQHPIELYCCSCSIHSSKKCYAFKCILTKFKGSHHQTRITCRGLSNHLTSKPKCNQLFIFKTHFKYSCQDRYFPDVAI